jgi:hypothetical protein
MFMFQMQIVPSVDARAPFIGPALPPDPNPAPAAAAANLATRETNVDVAHAADEDLLAKHLADPKVDPHCQNIQIQDPSVPYEFPLTQLYQLEALVFADRHVLTYFLTCKLARAPQAERIPEHLHSSSCEGM